MNTYGYVNENPVFWYDPEGLAKKKKPKGFGKSGGADHRSNARNSTTPKHQVGDAAKNQSRGKEKGDTSRNAPGRKPKGFRGPWPLHLCQL